MVVADEGYEALCQTDEADTESTVVDNALDSFLWFQLFCAYPEILHQQWELLGHRSLLELEALIELFCSDVENIVELGKEHVYALLLVFYTHALDGEFHDVNGREAQVTTSDAGLFAPTVFEYTCAATHGCNFPLVTLRIVGTPLLILVEGGIEVEEVREEATCSYLASQLVEVVVTIFLHIVNATLLFPNLDREDGSFAITYTLIGAKQNLSHDATALGAGISTIIDR